MAKEPTAKNLFVLENLEPRIMLSADPVLGVAGAGIAGDLENSIQNELSEKPVIDVVLAGEDIQTERQNQEIASYDPSAELDDIFSSLPENENSSDNSSLNDDVIEEDLSNDADHLVDDSESELITNSMMDLTDFARLLENELLARINHGRDHHPIESLTAYFFDAFETLINRSVYEYFNDSVDPPSMDGLISAIEDTFAQQDDTELVLTVDEISGTYDMGADEMLFELDVSADQDASLRLDLVQDADGSEVIDINYSAAIDLGIDFGIDIADEKGLFVETADLCLVVDAETNAADETVADVVDDLDLDISISVKPADAEIERIFSSDLRNRSLGQLADVARVNTTIQSGDKLVRFAALPYLLTALITDNDSLSFNDGEGNTYLPQVDPTPATDFSTDHEFEDIVFHRKGSIVTLAIFLSGSPLENTQNLTEDLGQTSDVGAVLSSSLLDSQLTLIRTDILVEQDLRM